MLGVGGHIVCTLTIGDGYPNTGHIHIKSVEGYNENYVLEDIKVRLLGP
jgi:hypothetical protein